jgi:hypothetical protein
LHIAQQRPGLAYDRVLGRELFDRSAVNHAHGVSPEGIFRSSSTLPVRETDVVVGSTKRADLSGGADGLITACRAARTDAEGGNALPSCFA